jgi:hypothetical protein
MTTTDFVIKLLQVAEEELNNISNGDEPNAVEYASAAKDLANVVLKLEGIGKGKLDKNGRPDVSGQSHPAGSKYDDGE